MKTENHEKNDNAAPSTSGPHGVVALSLKPITPWALALSLLWASPAAASSPAAGPSHPILSDWVAHHSPGHEVEVDLPVQPHVTRRVTPTFLGDVHTKVWVADGDTGQFTVSHTRLPTLANVLATDGMIYDGARDKLIEEHGGGRVLGERDLTGLFEREVTYELRDTRGVLVAVGRMLIGNTGDEVIVVNGVVVPGDTYELERFFASLRTPRANRS